MSAAALHHVTACVLFLCAALMPHARARACSPSLPRARGSLLLFWPPVTARRTEPCTLCRTSRLRAAPSLAQLTELLVAIEAACPEAVAWLLRVGLGWAGTTHLDMDTGDGPGFEEAGAWILKACTAASGSLAAAALRGAAACILQGE